MQKEMEQLERWLQEDEFTHPDEDPWNNTNMRPLANPLSMNDSPIGMGSSHVPPWQETKSQPAQLQLGFDDDFTVFISAPAGADPGFLSASGRSTPNASSDLDRLEPMHTGASYASLGSVSDFGENEVQDDDTHLPSKAEIQASSNRIFGSTLSLSTPKRRAVLSHGSSNTAAERTTAEDGESFETPHAFSTTFNPDRDAHPSLLEMEDDNYEVGNFDLSRVFNTLQNMKEEITGMEEEERRKAAARATLGLVYGLERQRDDDDDDGGRAA